MENSAISQVAINLQEAESFGLFRTILAAARIKHFRKHANVKDAEVSAWTIKALIADYLHEKTIRLNNLLVMEEIFKPAVNIFLQNKEYEKAGRLARIMATFSSRYSRQCSQQEKPLAAYLFKLATMFSMVSELLKLEKEGKTKVAGLLAAHIQFSGFICANDNMLDVNDHFTEQESTLSSIMWALIHTNDYIQDRTESKLNILHSYFLNARNNGQLAHFAPILISVGDEGFSEVFNEALAIYQNNHLPVSKFA